MPAIYNIYSDLNSQDVHEALLDTFRKWINFSLGVGRLGGRMLKNPSGRLASALRAETNREGQVVALYVDPEAEEYIQKGYSFGHKGFSLKRRMLAPGKPGVKVSKAGYLYRYVPISNRPTSPSTLYTQAKGITNLLTAKKLSQGQVLGINKNLAKMWAVDYRKMHGAGGSNTIRTMSNKPGSARWYVPAMPSFKPGDLLRKSLDKRIRDRVII